MPADLSLGLPLTARHPHYGLFQPVLDRFVLTLADYQQAWQICRLTSSKFPLYVCELSSAENYTPTLIDNTCCENWTMGSTSVITAGYPVQIDRLEPSTVMPSDIGEIKQQVFRAYYWTSFIGYLRDHIFPHHDAVMFVREMFDETADDQYQKLASIIQDIHRRIYFDTNSESIQQLIDSWPELQRAQDEFDQWLA